jgi:hypothetical protein
MTTYRVEGCLGVSVGTAKTISDASVLVLKQLPISAAGVANLAKRLAAGAVGGQVRVEYGGTGCTVYLEKD